MKEARISSYRGMDPVPCIREHKRKNFRLTFAFFSPTFVGHKARLSDLRP
jgi:hypothetical protein